MCTGNNLVAVLTIENYFGVISTFYSFNHFFNGGFMEIKDTIHPFYIVIFNKCFFINSSSLVINGKMLVGG